MQIDFHHTATYTLARFAGFSHAEAAIIGHSAQYVDDATNSGTIQFDNGAMYTHLASAHKMLDYRNFQELASRHVWLPFHFLPGNGGKPAGEDPDGSFINKIVCRPNSHVAADVIRSCIVEQHAPYGLHRLGITMHVFGDTWAHQGFAGVSHEVNDIRLLDDLDDPDDTMMGKLSDFFGDTFDRLQSAFVGGLNPIGHGAVLGYPDRPYLRWQYYDHRNTKVVRDNPRDYMEAAQNMVQAMQRYRAQDPEAEAPGLREEDVERFQKLLLGLTDPDEEVRHQAWIDEIAAGYFSFGPAEVTYIGKGEGSWKHQALQTAAETDDPDETFPFHPSFLDSDWKRFHDALQVHRFKVIHEILPRYGICAG